MKCSLAGLDTGFRVNGAGGHSGFTPPTTVFARFFGMPSRATASYVSLQGVSIHAAESVLILALLLLAAPLHAQDALDLHAATVLRSAPDVASWPITTAITRLELGASDCRLEFSTKETWPNVPIPNWNGGAIAYTLWMVRNVGGTLYTSGGIEFWNSTNGTPTRVGGCGPAAGYISNWFYDASWGPLHDAGELTPGETVGFFVTAGDARAKDVRTVTARSAVVAVPWPGGAGGVFTFGAGEAPTPVIVPPVVVGPPAITLPPPVPPIVSQPPVVIDYTALLKELLETEQDTNQKVTEIHAEVRTFSQQFGTVMAWVGKYVAPAIAAWYGGRAMAK